MENPRRVAFTARRVRLSRNFSRAESAEALQTADDRAICALELRAYFRYGAARIKHLHQGSFILLCPRLARVGQCGPLRPLRYILQHAVQRSDDLRPVADAVSRQALPRQRIDSIRQFCQQCFCLLQFHRHVPPFLCRVCSGELRISATEPRAI